MSGRVGNICTACGAISILTIKDASVLWVEFDLDKDCVRIEAQKCAVPILHFIRNILFQRAALSLLLILVCDDLLAEIQYHLCGYLTLFVIKSCFSKHITFLGCQTNNVH